MITRGGNYHSPRSNLVIDFHLEVCSITILLHIEFALAIYILLNEFSSYCAFGVDMENELWKKLEQLNDYVSRRLVIYNDISSGELKFKMISELDPYRFFSILGGEEMYSEKINWAFPFTYHDYVQNNNLKFRKKELHKWDLEERSIERAHATGFWHVTGIINLDIGNGKSLKFILNYSEGMFDGVSKTPYSEDIDTAIFGFQFF